MGKLTLLFISALSSAFIFTGPNAKADNVYVMDAIQSNTALRYGDATTSLVKDAVTDSGDHHLVRNQSSADYILQPKLLGLGDGYILTIEKRRGSQTVLAKQVRISSLDDLDKATRRATDEVLTTPVMSGATVEDVQNVNTASDWDRGVTPVYSFWKASVGPFGGTNLDTKKVLYSIALGHTWDIHPRVSVDAQAEAAFSTANEKAKLFNVAVGPSYYFTEGKNAQSPFASLDFGYGFGTANNDQSMNGFSLGVGLGYRFFRTATAGMELDLRWATLFDPVVNDGNPQIIGARLGVDF